MRETRRPDGQPHVVTRLTTAVGPADGTSGSDGSPHVAVLTTLAGGGAAPALSARTIAEAVRTAGTRPPEDGARLLIELTLAGGPWASGALARRLPSGEWGTWVGTGPLGQICDHIQWELGEGPACDALTTDLVSAPDLTTESRWSRWRAECEPVGGRAAVAVRLHAGRTLGSLTLYADRPVIDDRGALEHLHLMAAHLSVLLDAADRLQHLNQAMLSRGTIGQAIGVLVERYGIAADQAFATLRRISQGENVKIAQLATELVETGDLPHLHGS
jgi:hypothetical protein